jgi:hypothetical protein
MEKDKVKLQKLQKELHNLLDYYMTHSMSDSMIVNELENILEESEGE